MADQGLNQTNEANARQGSATNDASGKLSGDRGDAKAQPSGPRGDNPATAGPGETHVDSPTAEKGQQQLNPSSPGNTGTTPGSDAKLG